MSRVLLIIGALCLLSLTVTATAGDTSEVVVVESVKESGVLTSRVRLVDRGGYASARSRSVSRTKSATSAGSAGDAVAVKVVKVKTRKK